MKTTTINLRAFAGIWAVALVLGTVTGSLLTGDWRPAPWFLAAAAVAASAWHFAGREPACECRRWRVLFIYDDFHGREPMGWHDDIIEGVRRTHKLQCDRCRRVALEILPTPPEEEAWQ